MTNYAETITKSNCEQMPLTLINIMDSVSHFQFPWTTKSALRPVPPSARVYIRISDKRNSIQKHYYDGLSFFLFSLTAAGVVPYGRPKKSPRTTTVFAFRKFHTYVNNSNQYITFSLNVELL